MIATEEFLDTAGIRDLHVERPHKAVVVHSGARDSYQLALALHQAGSLESLVTDLFWPSDKKWAETLRNSLPKSARELAHRRMAGGLPSEKVRQCVMTGLRGLLLDRFPFASSTLRQRSNRWGDTTLGREAGKRAKATEAGLVTYSYYGYEAMRAYGRPAMLFQVHPHPASVRRLLQVELDTYPECSASLRQEWELALPESDYERLVQEPAMAACIMAASSFTRQTLVENGISPENIAVVPYGVDLKRFHPDPKRAVARTAPLQLLFVGRINQRKGIKNLLDAMRCFTPDEVQLTVCGRVVDDLHLFDGYGDQVRVRPSVDSDTLVKAYQAADLFVFPSVAEGFGQVLLEALACGVPILSTTHTAAPDLIEDGVQGFIVEPRRTDLLVDRIRWAVHHRTELSAMRHEARSRAEFFTWDRFRAGAAEGVRRYLTTLTTGSMS